VHSPPQDVAHPHCVHLTHLILLLRSTSRPQPNKSPHPSSRLNPHLPRRLCLPDHAVRCSPLGDGAVLATVRGRGTSKHRRKHQTRLCRSSNSFTTIRRRLCLCRRLTNRQPTRTTSMNIARTIAKTGSQNGGSTPVLSDTTASRSSCPCKDHCTCPRRVRQLLSLQNGDPTGDHGWGS
jgi:hypothetical protein